MESEGDYSFERSSASQPMRTPPEIRAKFSGPPTADDVTITLDGRRIEDREQMLEFLADIAEKRAGSAVDLAQP